MSILILGGTAEADILADLLRGHGIEFTYSLAGVTPNPKARVYPLHIGGFGGVIGLARYLTQNTVNMLVDATHPFASEMTKNALAASIQANVPMLRFERPEWDEPENANWAHAESLDQAAKILPAGARVFLSVGAQSMAEFAHRSDVDFVSRSIKPPSSPFSKTIVAKPPFDVAGEVHLFSKYRITHLVSKNAGGDQTSAKLVAAKQLGIKVIMVERPTPPVAEIARDITTAMAWIERRL